MDNEYKERYQRSPSPVNDFFTGHVASAAINESVYSNLPGRSDGPADAYRHVLLSAELTRRYGETYARLILNGHELTGNMQDQTKEANAMDIHNNELGIKIGNQLSQQPGGSSWDEVVFEARKTINPNNRNGSGARWLGEDKWRVNPKDETTQRELPTGHKDINWPPKWENRLYGDEQKRVPRYEDYDTRHEQQSSLSPANMEQLQEYYPNLAATGGYVKLEMANASDSQKMPTEAESSYERVHTMIQRLLNDEDGSYLREVAGYKTERDISALGKELYEAELKEEKEREMQLAQEKETQWQTRSFYNRSL